MIGYIIMEEQMSVIAYNIILIPLKFGMQFHKNRVDPLIMYQNDPRNLNAGFEVSMNSKIWVSEGNMVNETIPTAYWASTGDTSGASDVHMTSGQGLSWTR